MKQKSRDIIYLESILRVSLATSFKDILLNRHHLTVNMPLYPRGLESPKSMSDPRLQEVFPIDAQDSEIVTGLNDSYVNSILSHYYGDERHAPWGVLHIANCEGGVVYLYCVGERVGQVWVNSACLCDPFWEFDSSEGSMQRVCHVDQWADHLFEHVIGVHRLSRNIATRDTLESMSNSEVSLPIHEVWKAQESPTDKQLEELEANLDCEMPHVWKSLLREANGGQPINPIFDDPRVRAVTGHSPYPFRIQRLVGTESDDNTGRMRLLPVCSAVKDDISCPLAICSHNCQLQMVVRGPDRGKILLYGVDNWGPGRGVIVADCLEEVMAGLRPFVHSEWH